MVDTIKKTDRFLSSVEWKWSLANMAWGVPAAVASFALPAWAVRASKMFEEYAPLSWVVAGFAGLLAGAVIYAVFAWSRGRLVRARYDARMLAQGGAVDPLEKTFERKRIYINEFCQPSHPLIENKTFIDCEIIGPANILFVAGNSIAEGRFPNVDTVYLKNGARPNNVYLVQNCIFRGCNFSRVTFYVSFEETQMFRTYSLIQWITPSPYDEVQQEMPLTGGESSPPQLPLGIEPEAPL
jgi:hypothetical protein